MKRASIGISAHLGWAATSIVAFDKQGLRILRSDRIETAASDDRQAQEPYHVAGGFDGLNRVPPPANPEAVVRRGLQKQQRFTAQRTGGAGSEDPRHRPEEFARHRK